MTGILASCLLGHCAPTTGAAERPNIVFFLADDLGFMDIGANNPDTFYETPNIDHLAREGMRFTSGYAACPVCSPTRASIMTGKYPQRVGITDYIGAAQPEDWKRPTKLLPAAYKDRLELKEITLAEMFKAAGYATFFAGKWHLGSKGYWPEDQGFDINKGGTGAGAPSGRGKYFPPYENPRLEDGPPGEHLPDRLATETTKFISANRHQPFLAYLSFYSVHIPLMTTEDLKAKYEAKRKRLGLEPQWGREGQNRVRIVQEHAIYAGMVEAMDQAVGKVIAELEKSGVLKNTIIVFTSDNGGLSTSEGHPTSNLPYRAGKGWPYEGGVREPWIVVAHGTTSPGSSCDTPVSSPDFAPTLIDLAGIPAPKGARFDGISLVPLLRGKTIRSRPLFWHYPHYGNQGGAPFGAVREGDWKLLEWYEGGRIELYNVVLDPGEQQNLSDTAPGKAESLLKLLRKWRKNVGAKMPTPHQALLRLPPQTNTKSFYDRLDLFRS